MPVKLNIFHFFRKTKSHLHELNNEEMYKTKNRKSMGLICSQPVQLDNVIIVLRVFNSISVLTLYRMFISSEIDNALC